MKNALFFFAGSKGIGLTSHFTDISVDLFHKGQQEGFDVHIVSDRKEQNPGSWEKIETSIPDKYIIKYDELQPHELEKKLQEKLLGYHHVIFHLQGRTQILQTRRLIENNDIKTVVSMHSFAHGSPWKRPIISFLYSFIINKYIDKAIFLTPFAMNCFTGIKKLKRAGKIVHIPFNIPPLDIQYNIIDDGILEKEYFNIVYLAQFHTHKGHEKYLPAIFRFVKEHPEARVYFFGEGIRRNAVIEQIKNNQAERQIFCPGRIPRNIVPSILKKTSAALVLSGNETFGHCILEPMMMGVPTVSTRVGCGEYLIQDYVNGIGINSPKDLYNALSLLKNTPELGKLLAANGKQMVETFYRYENMLNAYFQLYKSLL